MRNDIRFAALSAAVAGIVLVQSARAASYTWTPTSGTFHWPTTSQNNWGTGIGGAFPSAPGDEANLSLNITGALTANLNQGITIGTLNIGDTDNSHGTNINTGTGTNTLTFQSATAGGQTHINVGGTGNVLNAVNANVALGGTSPLQINTVVNTRFRTAGGVTTKGNSISLTGGQAQVTGWELNGDLVGGGVVTVNSLGGISINGTKTYTGKFVLNSGVTGPNNAGSLTVTTGSIASASEVVLNGYTSGTGVGQAGGSLHAGNGADAASNPGQRFTQNKITFNGGTLSAGGQKTNGTWSTAVQDTIADIHFNSAFSTTVMGVGGGSAGTVLDVAEVSRSQGATAYVRSSTLAGTAQFKVGNGNDLLIGGGGVPGSTTMGIIPWLVAANANANAATASGFATYTANGFRALETAEYATSLTAGDTANYSGGGAALGSDAAINSIRMTASGTMNVGSGRTLTVVSGGVFFAHTSASIGTPGDTAAGSINFDSAEGIFWSPNSGVNVVGAVISGDGGITKSGVGTVVLAGTNTYSGDTHVSGGTLRVGNGTVESNLGVTGDVYVHNGAVLEILSSDAINDAESLNLLAYGLHNGKVNVGAGLIEVVGGLTLGDLVAGAGYYGSTAAYAANPSLQSQITINDVFFAGNGLIQVVPEPASLASLALVGMLLGRRRSR